LGSPCCPPRSPGPRGKIIHSLKIMSRVKIWMVL
jgi:hypothetical protein